MPREKAKQKSSNKDRVHRSRNDNSRLLWLVLFCVKNTVLGCARELVMAVGHIFLK